MPEDSGRIDAFLACKPSLRKLLGVQRENPEFEPMDQNPVTFPQEDGKNAPNGATRVSFRPVRSP